MIDLFDPGPGAGLERSAFADEASMHDLQKASLLGAERSRRRGAQRFVNAREQRRVLGDFVAEVGEQRRHLQLQRPHRLVAECARVDVENRQRALQGRARPFQGDHRVVDIRGRRVLGDDVDLGSVQAHRLHQCRLEVGHLDALELRDATVRTAPWLEQWHGRRGNSSAGMPRHDRRSDRAGTCRSQREESSSAHTLPFRSCLQMPSGALPRSAGVGRSPRGSDTYTRAPGVRIVIPYDDARHLLDAG